MKKKVVKIVAIVFVAVLLLDGIITAVSSFTASKDKEWGLELSTSNVSAKGATLTIERKNSKREEDLTVGEEWGIQRKTLFGWKDLKTVDEYGMIWLAIGYPMNEGDSKTWNLQWERSYGRLWPGIYRIYKDASTDDCYRHSEEEREEKNLNPVVYSTFFVLF